MKRLTKFESGIYQSNGKHYVSEFLDKVGKIEDIEEQLGCPLDVVFKALVGGIYIKNIYDDMVNFKCRLTYKNEELGWYFNIINGYVLIKDYKKTWFLKEDKSE